VKISTSINIKKTTDAQGIPEVFGRLLGRTLVEHEIAFPAVREATYMENDWFVKRHHGLLPGFPGLFIARIAMA
jgi:hypothetical protein